MSYGFDAVNQLVWIEPLAADADGRGGVLCLRHADAMVVPLGWMLDDLREPVPRLFRSAGVEPAPRLRRHRMAHPPSDNRQLSLGEPDESEQGAPVADVPPDESDADVESTTAEPWRPVFDQTDDLDGLLTSSSPLLSRAFGKRPLAQED